MDSVGFMKRNGMVAVTELLFYKKQLNEYSSLNWNLKILFKERSRFWRKPFNSIKRKSGFRCGREMNY